MYRAICLYALRNTIISEGIIDEKKLLEKLDEVTVSFEYDKEKNQCQTFLDGQNVENEIRGLWVSENVSKISKIKAVRQKMISIQREIGKNKGVVMDGRDIGSVVFPDAELKLFVTASVEERARRRALELKDVSFEDVLNNLKERDNDDSTRKENPLIISENAVVIDNTNMSKEEQFETVLKSYQNIISN
jgi:cytidylate kinase